MSVRQAVYYVRQPMPFVGAEPGDYLLVRPDHPTAKLMVCVPKPDGYIPLVESSACCDLVQANPGLRLVRDEEGGAGIR